MTIQPEWFQWGPAVAILIVILSAVGGFLLWYFKRVAKREDSRDSFLEKMVNTLEERNREHISAWKAMVKEDIETQQAGVAAMRNIEAAMKARCEQAERIHTITVQHLLELKQTVQKS